MTRRIDWPLPGSKALNRRGARSLKRNTTRCLARAPRPGEIDTARQLDELKHQDALTESVLKTANAERDRLVEIDAEAKAAAFLLNTDADQLGVMLKLRDLENERLKIMAQQLLAEGTARDGVRAFFLEMEQSAETTGQIIYNALNSAFGKLSENLTQLVTGGKTKFGQMFKDIGRDLVDASIKKSLQTGLGALGKKLGIGGKARTHPEGPDTRYGDLRDSDWRAIKLRHRQRPEPDPDHRT